MIKNRMANIFMVLLFTIISVNAFAGDKWSETPNLNDETEILSMTNRSTTLNLINPYSDFWTETPDLNTGNLVHSVKIDIPHIVRFFNPKMYDETPDIR